jgi:hypothetical protein
VAVLGAPPESTRTPLAGIPYSGVARDKVVADLSDAELAHLTDFLTCLGRNGYSGYCYGPLTMKYVDVAVPPFHSEAPAAISGDLTTCIPSPLPPYEHSREGNMYIYRNQYGACQVAVIEDCERETVAAPAPNNLWAPDCAAFDVCIN